MTSQRKCSENDHFQSLFYPHPDPKSDFSPVNKVIKNSGLSH